MVKKCPPPWPRKGEIEGANQPINAIVMTWSAELPPLSWTTLRDQWWRWHLVRVATGLVGLSLIIAATLKRG